MFYRDETKNIAVGLQNTIKSLSLHKFQCAVCCNMRGITEREFSDNFQPEMQRLADKNGWTIAEAHQRLKDYYDGYHFSEDNMVDVYNPYSLVNAFSNNKILNFWASSGATSMLHKFIENLDLQLDKLHSCFIDGDTLCTSDVTGGGIELFLFQSGCLTIKGF